MSDKSCEPFTPFIGLKRIQFDCRADLSLHLNKSFFFQKEYAVIWYGKIYNNNARQHASKSVEVFFTELNSGYETSALLPVEIIPKVPIGSIWKDGKSCEKFDLENFSLAILGEQEVGADDATSNERPNLKYINHFGVTRNLEKSERYLNSNQNYAFDLNDYPVRDIKNDTNTLLSIEYNDRTFVIHPLLFFNAHYGVSKEINRILLTYFWGNEKDSDPNSRTIRTLLNLDYENNKCPKAVLIPMKCVIADAVFLHHLKNRELAQEVVRKLSSRVFSKLANKKSAPLKIEPYHDQLIEMTIAGLALNDGTILCTEITGISMPIDSVILYDLAGYVNTGNDGSTYQAVKPMYREIDTETIVLEASKNGNNATTAVVRCSIETLGETTKLLRNGFVSLNEAVHRGQQISLPEPTPETYAGGERVNSGGDVGMLRVLMEAEVIGAVEHQFDKLLRHAQELKANHRVEIDCYTPINGFMGEEVLAIKVSNGNHSFPNRMYVLRLIIDRRTYFVFDCELKNRISNSGMMIKTDDHFNPKLIINELFANKGKIYEDTLQDLTGNIAFFRHRSEPNSNWIKNAFDKI